MPSPGTTDWLFFQTAENVPVTDGIDWVNPEYALSESDLEYASLPTPSDEIVTPSDILKITNPIIIGLPDVCTITAMRFRLRIEGLNDGFGGAPHSLVQVVIGDVGVGDNLHYPLMGSGIVTGEYESELTPTRAQIGTDFGIQRRVQSNNVGGEYRVYTVSVQFDFTAATGGGELPAINGKAHQRID
jgi:hypothetical protein